VFWKILSIIDYHKPTVLENVKNLVTRRETDVQNHNGQSYFIRYKVLNTAEITGIPQHRKGFILCA
jgi:site-specific DNA-cytosine methylase